MALTFIHTGDVHIGAKFNFLGEKGKEHRRQIETTFENVVDLAIEKKVDAFLIAGDLFDNTNPSQSSISFVKRQFKKLQESNIWVIAIPGTHDRLVAGSVFAKEKFEGENIKVFLNGAENFFIPELETTFYAKPNTSNKSTKSPLEGLKKSEEGRYHISLAHGSFQIEGKSSKDDYPIAEANIKISEMNYVALAHWHNPLDVSQGEVKAYYCGSPELVATDQKNRGAVLFVSLDESGSKTETIEIGSKLIKQISLDIEKIESLENLEAEILNAADENLILSVEITGIRSEGFVIDTEQLIDSLQGKFFTLSITDRTVLDISALNEDEYPDNYVLGKFIQKVKEGKDLTDEQKGRVLSYGIELLKGNDVL